MTTVKVTITPAAVLRSCIDLAERRDGEDVFERQARTLDELGYAIVNREQAEREAAEVEALRAVDKRLRELCAATLENGESARASILADEILRALDGEA